MRLSMFFGMLEVSSFLMLLFLTQKRKGKTGLMMGFAAKRFFQKATERVVRFMPAVSSIAIVVILALIVSANATRLASGGLTVLLVVVLHNMCGLLLGYLIAAALRLPEPKRRALCIEVGMQNSGLAASLAAVHFAAYPMAAVPGAIFSVWHNLSGALVARLFARKPCLGDRQCV